MNGNGAIQLAYPSFLAYLKFGIEGGFYPNFCSDAKNAPKGTKEFYPTSPIETKFRPSKNRQTGNWDLQTAPITSKCWRSP